MSDDLLKRLDDTAHGCEHSKNNLAPLLREAAARIRELEAQLIVQYDDAYQEGYDTGYDDGVGAK